MTRLFIILPLFVLFLPCSVAAQEEVPWLSLSRLSVTAATSYHFSPWKKYNESLQLAQDAIRYDPYYGAPKGSFEKILGDGTIELSVGYRLVAGLSISVIGGYTSTSSDGNFSYSVLGPSTTGGYVSLGEQGINQKISLNVLKYGVDVQYRYEIFEDISLVVSASALKAHGNFSFAYELQGSNTTFSFSAVMNDAKSSYQTSLGVLVKLHGPVSLNSSVEYRWLKFPDFRGEGTYSEQSRSSMFSEDHRRSFPASLGEADGYFGLYVPYPEGYYINEQLLRTLWDRTSVPTLWYTTRKPTILDLSGVGIKIGVQFEF